MQVEGGFLDGLDVRFADGLNVLIGGRGTGKSSIIELIRYCLDVRGTSDDEDASRARDQALSVLQDGQVSLSLEVEDSHILVSRSVDGAPVGLDAVEGRPLIFSQKDVEAVGLSARGRLNIVSLFASQALLWRLREQQIATQVRSLTTEIRGLLGEADQVADRLAGEDALKSELMLAEARAIEVSQTSMQLEQKQKQLEALSTASTKLSVRLDALRRALTTTTEYRDVLSDSHVFGYLLDQWPDRTADPLVAARRKLKAAEASLSQAYAYLSEALDEIGSQIRSAESEKAPLEDQARAIRREVEGLKEGAGAAARHLAGLREQASQIEALKLLRSQKLERVARVQEVRNASLTELYQMRSSRYASRQRAARRLSEALKPNIRVRVQRAAQLGEYIGAITSALRGSGLRYNELATSLARSMTPRDLINAVENDDAASVGSAAKISRERAERVVSQLRTSNTEGIVAVPIEDTADFDLLDGAQFKPMDQLSVGQRCTVMLSILLQESDRVLVVDQPEDHLDNAFIAETLISAIRQRSSKGQLIFSTHNANIPVLGEAARVIRLGSNGKRGFVVHADPLDHHHSVDSIKSIMEGGSDAFRKRSSFYLRHSNE